MSLDPIKREYKNENHLITDYQYPIDSGFGYADMDQLIQYLYSNNDFLEEGGLPEISELRYRHQTILFNFVDRLPDADSYVISQFDKRTRIGRDLTNSIVCEWENKIEAAAVSSAYNYSNENKLPRLAYIEKTDFGNSRYFLQVIWPICKDGEVTQYLTAAHYLRDFKLTPRTRINRALETSDIEVHWAIDKNEKACLESCLLPQEKEKIIFSFIGNFDAARQRYSSLNNYNQYHVARAAMSVEMSGKPIDISALIAFTGINRSTIYDILKKMVKSDLIEIYTIPEDNRRKYVRATGRLKSDFLNFLRDVDISIKNSACRLN